MQGLLSHLAGLPLRKQAALGVAIVVAVAAFLAIVRMATAPQMVLLYGGLDAAAAGEVVLALEQRGAVHEVRAGAVYVPAQDRDALRVSLAADGLPANGPAGYELLDSISGFGTTSQMFDATYWRAKEGELARTIMSAPGIQSARVHLSAAQTRPFARNAAASASVTLIPSGGTVAAAHARALRYLVASAVAGLDPEAVSVIDGRNGRIVTDDTTDTGMGTEDRAAELRRRAERILEARVGPGNAIVEVSVDTVTQSELVRERILDPDSRVLISSDTEERSAAANDTRPGPVTVASNLPDGDAEGGGARSSSDDTETRERSNFDVSETTREVTRGPGGIERITVAVLVNSARSSEVAGDAAATSAEDDLDALQALVASAVGIDESRGDVVTIRSLPFTERPVPDAPSAGIAAQLTASLNLMQLVQFFTLAAVTLVLALFVVRPMLVRRPLPAAVAAGPGMAALPPPSPREVSAVLPPSAPRQVSDPSQSLVRAVGEKRSEAADVLRTWISQDDPAR